MAAVSVVGVASAYKSAKPRESARREPSSLRVKRVLNGEPAMPLASVTAPLGFLDV
jgi:hypothetical protein